MTGVYILRLNNVVMYVGATAHWPGRIAAHKKIQFDEARFFECGEDELLRNETRFIRFLKPKHNVRDTNKRVWKRITKEWVLANADEIKATLKDGSHDILGDRAKKELGFSSMTNKPDIFYTILREYCKATNQTWKWVRGSKITLKPLKP